LAKKTALQAALQREGGRLAAQQLGITAGILVAFALAAGCFAQAFGVWQENVAAAELDRVRSAVAEQATSVVAARQQALKQALDDVDLKLALASVDDVGRQRATVLLKQRLPDMIRAEFYAPDLPELVDADLAAFGYARANILSEARASGGVARAQAMRDADGALQLVLAQAVLDGDLPVAYAYVVLPGNDLAAPVGDVSVRAGTLQIRQGVVGAVIASTSGASGAPSFDDRLAPIAQSIFSVATQRAEMFKIGDYVPLFSYRSPLGLAAVGTLLLMLSVVFLVARGAMARTGEGNPLTALGTLLRRAPAEPKDDGPVMPKTPVSASPRTAATVSSAPADAAPVEPVTAPGSAARSSQPAAPSAPSRGTAVDRSIFRAYDIRGVVGSTLTRDTARLIGQAIGSAVRDRGLSEVVVARDGRLSGPELSAELIKGLRSAGCNVIDIGAVPTPVLYFATYHLNTGSGVMVTGSHNPPDYNGFKIMVGGETLAEEQIQDLYARIAEGRLATGNGTLQSLDVAADYVERITGDVQVERPLKVVVDAGNGIAGALGPQVLEGIGCEVIPLYCEVDGNFPNHHPDPSDPHNLDDLITSVRRLGADLGMAFDGDGDRLGVVTRAGEIIYPDRLLMLFAIDVLNRNPGATIIYDVKCTGHLQDVILRHGGSPIMWKTGHSLIKSKMREEDAELAGEMSGHFFFRERWFGFDDGIYSAARLAEILGASDRAPEAVFADLPKGVSTPELKVPMAEGAHYAYIAKFRERASFQGARISTIDGVRADFADGWGLVRCSNTTPNLVLRFDAADVKSLNRIQALFREQMLAVDPSLALPF
jgi:phosphomannomutase/phosphoglucomutase